MEIVVGTYEEVLLGYRLVDLGKKWQFEQSFTDNSHSGCIKTVTISNKGILASGGTDETIKLFNLKKRSELGSLVHHSGTVTGLEFYHGNHMFSVSEDGTVAVWKYYTWECLKTLKGHKSGINGISVHPSGKMALTVARDKTLKTWNLITGKCAYTTNMKSVADLVMWSTEGTYYAIVFQTKIDVYKVETAAVHCSVTVERRPNAVAFLSDTILVYGCEGGTVHFYDVTKNKQIHQIETQTSRIRGLCLTVDQELHQCLVTASSDGQIKLYQVNHTEDDINTILLAEHDSKFRLTCVSVYSPKLSTEKDDSGDHVTQKNEVPKEDKSEEKTDDQKSKKQKKKLKTEKIQETHLEKDSLKSKLVTFNEDVKEEKKKAEKRKMKSPKNKAKKIKS